MTAVRPSWRRLLGDRAESLSPEGEPFDRRIRLVVLAAVVLGTVLRVWLVLSPLGPYDSDEAVAGLMGRHFLDGEFRAFYWGQPYGGTHEAALLALLFAMGTPVRLAMEGVPIALSAVAAVLVWRIGLRTVGRHAGLLAAALLWTTTAVFVWQSTKERSFYATTLVAGLAVTLLALRLLARPSRLDALLLGVAGGIGWHSSPNIVYFAAPALVWLVAESVRLGRRDVLRLWWVAAGGAVVGGLPWIASNLASGGASFDLVPYSSGTTYLNRLGLFFKEALPYALGVQTPHEPMGWPSALLYLLLLAGVIVAVVRLPRPAWGIGVGLVVFPFVFAAFPTSWYVGEPRYLSFLWPFVVLAVAAALVRVHRRRPGVAVVALGVIALYTVAGTAVMVERSEWSVVGDYSPGDLTPLVAQLGGEEAVFADYWIAYRLALATEERIVAAPLDTARYPPYVEQVRAVAVPAYVFFRQSCVEGEFLRYLGERGITSVRREAGRFSVVQPAQRVLPEDGFMARVFAQDFQQGQICPPGTRRLR
ncbi:MAG: glycosyltransferase family 39 protein [Actinomycetota bacterium]|nr:glycosyltransferase family 39 protein [Actinomycetota bacterium]